jgi:PAS domain S-box-containing protein
MSGELERKAEIAELLLDVARQLGETLEPERIYERFHALLADVIQHDGIVVSAYDDRDGLIRCEYAWVEGNRLDPTILPPLPLNRAGGGMQSRVIVSGEPLLANDVEERVRDKDGTYYDVDREGKVRKLPESGPSRTKAAMMVPVKHEGRVVGVMQLMSDRQYYEAEQLEVVEGLVAQMAAAVRNARLQDERRRLEAAEAAARAVAAEREQAALVLDAVGDGIFLIGDDGAVQLWNRAAEELVGLAADEARGRPLAEALPRWEALVAQIPVAEARNAARPVTLPLNAGGRELWLSFIAVRGAGGVVYAFRDMTAERRLEEERSDFVATVSHELRTPMAAVFGAAETLRRRERELAPEDARALLEMIATQAARLSQITDEVLLTTQLDRGDIALDRAAVDVGEVARSVVHAMTAQRDDSPALLLDVHDPVEPASADPDRIQQVLVNLVDNAFKHGGGAPVTVRVDSANGVVRLAVTDAGPGIGPADQERIFEKFYRGGPQLTRTSGGTGLGLYISRELVHRMGGRIGVQSEPGSGTTFVVELPRA